MDSNSLRPEVIDSPFPWPAYDWLRDNEPIRRVETAGGGTAWLITRYDDVRELLSDPRVSSDSQNPGFPRFGAPTEPEDQRLFLRMDPPQHTIFRDLLAKNFTLGAMRKMRPAIQELVDETIDTMLSKPQGRFRRRIRAAHPEHSAELAIGGARRRSCLFQFCCRPRARRD